MSSWKEIPGLHFGFLFSLAMVTTNLCAGLLVELESTIMMPLVQYAKFSSPLNIALL